MLSTPPKTGNATLDAFLQEIYQKSLELEEKTIPEEGWSLTDLRSDLSEVISDRRDLIDIVTKYDDLKGYSEAISAQKEYLDSILAETRKIDEHSQWFAEIMEWWDQNYRVIQDSKATMSSAAAADYADAAKTSETNAKASETAAATSATQAKTSETNADTKATQASTSATNAKTSETNAKASETAAKGSADAAAASATKTGQDVAKTAADRVAVENAATSASWSGDFLNILGTTSPSLRGPKGDPGKDGTGGGIVVVGSKEEAAALPIGTVYAIATEVAPSEPGTPEPAPVTIVGTDGKNITTDTFTPTILNATTRDTIIIAANTKAVSGSTVTAPAGFTTLVDGYWTGTQRSWVFTGPWSDDLTVTADQPLEFAYAAVAVRGARSVIAGRVKDRIADPIESTTVTAPAVNHGTNDLAIGIAFERTSAVETVEQVTVNAGWTIEHYTAQGANIQTTLIGVGGNGDMVVTYPNAQTTNGAGVQVVARA